MMAQSNVSDNEVRWGRIGSALNSLNRALQPYVESELQQYFNQLSRINDPSSPLDGCLQDSLGNLLRYDPDNEPTPPKGLGVQLCFRALPSYPSNTKGNNPVAVKDGCELGRLYLQEYYRKEADCQINKLDAGAILLILGRASCFPYAVRTQAQVVREDIRNKWAHATLPNWDQNQFDEAFAKIENLSKLLPSNYADPLINRLDEDKKGKIENEFMKKLISDAQQIECELRKETTKIKNETIECIELVATKVKIDLASECDFLRKDMLDIRKNGKKKLLIIGKTGVGKSSLCNVISGHSPDSSLFPVSDSGASCTQRTQFGNIFFNGDVSKDISLIDTIGFDDPLKEENAIVISELVYKLKYQCDFINMFAIVIDGNNPRLDSSLLKMIGTFEKMFSHMFWSQVIIVFSKLSMDQKQTKKRQKHTNRTDDDRAASYLKDVEAKFEKGKNLKYIFLDAHYDKDDPDELESFDKALNYLYENLCIAPELSTDHVNLVKNENNRLKRSFSKLGL